MAKRAQQFSTSKPGKKGKSSAKVDMFTKKEWFDLRVPSCFPRNYVGKTLTTRLTAKQNIEKNLLGRTFVVNQADMSGNEAENCRNFKFLVEDVQGRDCVSSFYSMELTTDRSKGIAKKFHTLVDSYADVRLVDGFVLRIFTVCQSSRLADTTRKLCYIHSTVVKDIRRETIDIIKEVFAECDIIQAMRLMMEDRVACIMEERVNKNIAPVQNCFTKKVKVVKRPKYVPSEFVVSEENLIDDQQNLEMVY